MKHYIYILSVFVLFCGCQKEEQTNLVPTTNSNVGSVKIIEDEFEGVPLIVVGSAKDNYIVAFESTLEDGTKLSFKPVQSFLPIILEDEEGNRWNVQGKAVAGPRYGQQLKTVSSYMGYWFAWAAMFHGIKLYDGPTYNSDFVPNEPAEDWSIPTDHVFTCLGIDDIPAIDEPVFEEYHNGHIIQNESYFIGDDELVVGITIDNKTRIYPHRILNWHEIVNDQIGDFYFSLSYCPISGTAVMWDRTINGSVTSFGVSGLIYNGNVMPYDRSTESIWSQMKLSCVNGTQIGSKMNDVQMLETTWQTWKTIHGNPDVLSLNTGFSKDYESDPYAAYLADPDYNSYPVEYLDDRVRAKERVLGVIINDKAKAYQFKDFE